MRTQRSTFRGMLRYSDQEIVLSGESYTKPCTTACAQGCLRWCSQEASEGSSRSGVSCWRAHTVIKCCSLPLRPSSFVHTYGTILLCTCVRCPGCFSGGWSSWLFQVVCFHLQVIMDPCVRVDHIVLSYSFLRPSVAGGSLPPSKAP